MKRITFFLLLFAAAVVSPSLLSVQTFSSPEREFWSNPENVRGFLGSYGFQAETEPTINREEQALFRELAPLMADDLPAAARLLEGRLKPDSSAALDFILGNIHFQLNNLAGSERHYRNAIEKFPGFMRAHKNLGLIHTEAGNFEDALISLTHTLELGGTGGDLYGLIGFCYFNLERYHSAESAYRQAILFEPGNLEWKQGIARCLLVQEKYREARLLFDELIAKHPTRADFYLHQANVFLALEQPRQAAINYEIVRRLGAATESSLINLADLYLSENILDLAHGVYIEALSMETGERLPRYLRAAASFAAHRSWEKASALLKEVAKHDLEEKDSIEMKKVSARIDLTTGNEKEAVQTLEEVLSLDPLDGGVLILLGEHYGRNGEPERAELYFERAARSASYAAEARLRHAELLVAENRLGKAAELLRRAQETAPQERIADYLNRVERALAAREHREQDF